MREQKTRDSSVSQEAHLRKLAEKDEEIAKFKKKYAEYSKKNNRLQQSLKEKDASNKKLRVKNLIQRDRIKYFGRLESGESKPVEHRFSSTLITLNA